MTSPLKASVAHTDRITHKIAQGAQATSTARVEGISVKPAAAGAVERELSVPRSLVDVQISLGCQTRRNSTSTTMEMMALAEVHKAQRPGDPPTQESARNLLTSYFFDPKRYDLGRVGRYKLNKKLGVDVPDNVHTLTLDDLVGGIRYLIEMDKAEDEKYGSDDIDHLRNKRVRSVGELLQNQLRSGMLRMERVARERLTSLETVIDRAAEEGDIVNIDFTGAVNGELIRGGAAKNYQLDLTNNNFIIESQITAPSQGFER